MTDAVRDTAAMIAGMAPVLDPNLYCFVTTSDKPRAAKAVALALATFREAEGMSLILPMAVARNMAFPSPIPMMRITLTVHSALDGVGLTAVVASVLAEAQIPCNMVAAYHHDHVFVPADLADRALAILQQRAAGR